MSVTAGVLSQVNVTGNSASLSSAAASGGTSPYTYQWYRDTTTGFTPAAGNLLTGETALTLSDTGLSPNTTYFYKVVATDTGAGDATDTSAEMAVVLAAYSPDVNQFQMSTIVGMLAMGQTQQTESCMVASTVTADLQPGQPVKRADVANGIPVVTPCTSVADDTYGYIVYQVKNRTFTGGDIVTVARNPNTIYLVAGASGAAGAKATLDVTHIGVAGVASGSGGEDIVGEWVDKPVINTVGRVALLTTSYHKDA